MRAWLPMVVNRHCHPGARRANRKALPGALRVLRMRAEHHGGEPWSARAEPRLPCSVRTFISARNALPAVSPMDLGTAGCKRGRTWRTPLLVRTEGEAPSMLSETL